MSSAERFSLIRLSENIPLVSFRSLTSIVTARSSERRIVRCYPFREIASSFNPLITLFKSRPFPPKMLYSISIHSTMIVSDSLPRQYCFVSLSVLSPDHLRRAEARVSQVVLMSFGTCRLSYPGEKCGSLLPIYQTALADFAHKIGARLSRLWSLRGYL